MATLKAGTVKRIHINGALLRKHLKAAKPISIRTRKDRRMQVLRAADILVMGPSRLVYEPKKPLSSGAVLWIETTSEVMYT